MSYAKVKQQIAEQGSQVEKPRTGYRCKAHGCPNAGCIDGVFGIDNSGLCHHHWVEPDSSRWAAITQQIRADFQRMRNH